MARIKAPKVERIAAEVHARAVESHKRTLAMGLTAGYLSLRTAGDTFNMLLMNGRLLGAEERKFVRDTVSSIQILLERADAFVADHGNATGRAELRVASPNAPPRPISQTSQTDQE